MKYFNKVTRNPPPWARGSIIGSNSQLDPRAGSRPIFSNPLDEAVFDVRFDKRQVEQMNVKEATPTDKAIGGEDV